MPTGMGKSAAMSLLPFVLPARRVLLVPPSRLLRGQLAAELSGLQVLRRVAAVSDEVPPPTVVEVEHRRRTPQSWNDLVTADVVVGTPNVLSPSYAEIAQPPPDMFDLVIFDEAHHTSAATYSALLDAFPAAAVALFTATPFRRDRHPLPGVPVYIYGLAQAFEGDVLAPVTFVPLDVSGASLAEHDRALAKQAAERLRSPEHKPAGSRILARTRTVLMRKCSSMSTHPSASRWSWSPRRRPHSSCSEPSNRSVTAAAQGSQRGVSGTSRSRPSAISFATSPALVSRRLPCRLPSSRHGEL